jgi:hypothetical protein
MKLEELVEIFKDWAKTILGKNFVINGW